MAPGATTAPLLIVASIWLLVGARAAHPRRQHPLAHGEIYSSGLAFHDGLPGKKLRSRSS
jgi:hypothetical protein